MLPTKLCFDFEERKLSIHDKQALIVLCSPTLVGSSRGEDNENPVYLAFLLPS